MKLNTIKVVLITNVGRQNYLGSRSKFVHLYSQHFQLSNEANSIKFYCKILFLLVTQKLKSLTQAFYKNLNILELVFNVSV